MVSIHVERDKKDITKDFSGTIAALLDELKINKETIVVVKNGEVVSETDKCEGDDKLKLLSVVSGG